MINNERIGKSDRLLLSEKDKLQIFEILIKRFGDRADNIMKEILMLF